MKQKHENIIIQIIPFFFCAIVFFTTIHCSSKLKWTVFWKKLVFITPRSRWCHSCFCFYIDAKPFFTIIIKYHLKITEALEDTVHIWSCRVLEAISLVYATDAHLCNTVVCKPHSQVKSKQYMCKMNLRMPVLLYVSHRLFVPLGLPSKTGSFSGTLLSFSWRKEDKSLSQIWKGK